MFPLKFHFFAEKKTCKSYHMLVLSVCLLLVSSVLTQSTCDDPTFEDFSACTATIPNIENLDSVNSTAYCNCFTGFQSECVPGVDDACNWVASCLSTWECFVAADTCCKSCYFHFL
eukprot:TRINITY_DN7903_c0_g1_i1.p1 TRINITY_DN7903_c0_g1~~TRINITY_DN7903_c0_g1_i1.p1  ORF type:complete len:116 (+),score=9.68 TRINITY_DN7903_c0_g1_i1:91-438(+)